VLREMHIMRRIGLRLARFLLIVSVCTVRWVAWPLNQMTLVLIRLTLLLIKAIEEVARKQSTL
jgi:hypothetical protein